MFHFAGSSNTLEHRDAPSYSAFARAVISSEVTKSSIPGFSGRTLKTVTVIVGFLLCCSDSSDIIQHRLGICRGNFTKNIEKFFAILAEGTEQKASTPVKWRAMGEMAVIGQKRGGK